MKRKIGIYILLIAIIVGAAPYLVGFLVENRFKDIVQAASELNSLSVTIVEYQRGWRQSHAKTRVTFHGDMVSKIASNFDSRKDELSVMINHDIRHGPFVQLKEGDYTDWNFALANIKSDLSLTEEAKKQLIAVVGETELLTMNSEIKIDGTTKANLNSKELKIKDGEHDHILWKGLKGDWELSRDYKRIQGKILMPGFEAHIKNKREQSEISIIQGADIVLKTERFRTADELWLGTAEVNVQSLQISDATKPYFMMTGFAASGVTDTENGMIESSGTIRIESIKLNDTTYGPANYTGSVKNIAPAVMKSFIDTSKAMQTASASEQEKYAQQLITIVPEFLKTRPLLQIDDMSLRTPQGEVKSNFSFAVGGPEAYDTQNIQQIIQSIEANGNVVLPKALFRDLLIIGMEERLENTLRSREPNITKEAVAEEANKAANELIKKEVQEGLWVDNGTTLTLAFTFKQGQLIVNGKPLDLMKLLFEVKTQGTQAPTPAYEQGGSQPPSSGETGTSSMSAPQ